MADNILQDFADEIAQQSTERISTVEGYEVHSWYNESRCNWEAWIFGVGSRTSRHNREEAISEVVLKAKAEGACE